jgi:hypothetical protein
MKRRRLMKKAEGPQVDDLSFPVSYSEQGKYLLLADKFLALHGKRRNVVAIDSSKHFQAARKQKKIA